MPVRLRFAHAAVLASLAAPAFAAAPAVPPQWQVYWDKVQAADAIADDEARCKAYPDLPGNQWLPGAAQGRCSLLRAPAWSLDQIEQSLRGGGAAELDRRFAALLAQHYNDQAQREQIFRAFKAFDASARASAAAQRWLKDSPQSAFARVALASHYQTIGEDARGFSALSQVGEAQQQDMRTQFAKAVPLYEQALKLEPRLSVACVQEMAIGRHLSKELEASATQYCQAIDPDSYYVVYGRILASQPNWGGSMPALRAAVEDARQRVERNPILGALVGEADGFPVSPISGTPMVAGELARVSQLAPSGTLMSYAARAYGQQGDHWQAFVYASQATRYWPHNADFRALRATALVRLERSDWALRDFRQAVEDAPQDADALSQLVNLLLQEGKTDEARAYVARMRTVAPENFGRAQYFLCAQLAQSRQVGGEAVRCVNELAAAVPQVLEVVQLRAYILYMAKDPGALAAVDALVAWPNPDDDVRLRAVIDRARAWKNELQPGNAPAATPAPAPAR
ncbi:tetratricopeptide repeat protein [Lysobacter enzymogenes]|uniref:tetratricopeptide repeat protein n=1 Tax=Lysobacter enzymogenes TaxID=69 RepID=UPI001A97C7D6|nr:tetratricopeptide repeat protein [Lysobacter enzymogenes]QQP96781.1 tetratricopeptide repeat protein [Lysobacter enzymogenes]